MTDFIMAPLVCLRFRGWLFYNAWESHKLIANLNFLFCLAPDLNQIDGIVLNLPNYSNKKYRKRIIYG